MCGFISLCTTDTPPIVQYRYIKIFAKRYNVQLYTLCSKGYSAHSMACNQLPCPVHGVWLSWQPWTTCSATCGLGTVYLYITFNNLPYYQKIIKTRSHNTLNSVSIDYYAERQCGVKSLPRVPVTGHNGESNPKPVNQCNCV